MAEDEDGKPVEKTAEPRAIEADKTGDRPQI
jgi:hypothetical protein